MAKISFSSARQCEVNKAIDEWQRKLPRAANQIGGPIIQWIEHPQTDEICTFTVPDDFMVALRESKIPFTME